MNRKDVEALMKDRPDKFTPEDVDYRPAPEGSAIRCSACFHMYLRVIDNHSVCELIRSDQIDEEGIKPDYRCDFYTCDGDVTPLYEEKPKVEMAEYSGSDPT